VVLAEVNPDLREVRFEYAGRLKDGRRPEGGPRAKRADSKERGKEQGKHAAKGGRQARAGGGGKRDKRSRDRTSGRARRR
jgi:hypothetical protein